ncbi:hypothetical protein [Arenibaculum pallidiluteum]|uniref:hypothetical protein n=1 Tax=Arenibaculum pallidiluteum TaxID=2812559 RepID=UPI001A973F11|nr:hypothetical protein [Arenibaculum pallidiluteum]
MFPSTSPSVLAGTAPRALLPAQWARLTAEILRRQRVLGWFGLALLALLLPAAVAWLLDGRTLDGVAVWTKPMKFLASVALFSLTMAWFFGYLPEERRHSRTMRLLVGVLVATASFEIAYIALQAARGEASHFNRSTPYHTVMYALMGMAALLLTATAPLLGREIARHGDRSLAPAFRLAVVLGLVLTFALGATEGLFMSAQPGHGIGPSSAGAALPVVGWSTVSGDLRAAHFLGIHAQQIVPVAGAAFARLVPRHAVPAVWAFAATYAVLTVLVFVQALMGLPLFAI